MLLFTASPNLIQSLKQLGDHFWCQIISMELSEHVRRFHSFCRYYVIKYRRLSTQDIYRTEGFVHSIFCILFFRDLAELLLKLGNYSARVLDVFGQRRELFTLPQQAYQVAIILFQLVVFNSKTRRRGHIRIDSGHPLDSKSTSGKYFHILCLHVFPENLVFHPDIFNLFVEVGTFLAV